MVRFFVFIICLMIPTVAGAQGLTAFARVSAEGTELRDGWFGATQLNFALSRGVPYRVFTLEGPPRLVVDFSDVDFLALDSDDFKPRSKRLTNLRFGRFAPGWSRFVADLTEPMVISTAEMRTDNDAATLEITLKTDTVAAFAAASGAPEGVTSSHEIKLKTSVAPAKTDFLVVLDPGHGGIDPGAEREGLVEKHLALDFARVLQDILRRDGIAVEMTRDSDIFVSLEGRTAFAHQRQASVFVSIHADALPGGGAHGATVYTLSEKASDVASEQLAARHNRSDIIAGLDLTGTDDEVTGVLLDIMRRETEPRSAALAKSIIAGMHAAGGPMNKKPWRKAGFSVLKSADIPSVLVEIGFLSSAQDRKNLRDPVWRGVIAGGLADAILKWRDEDAARAQLVRQ